jgi:hypothetical protein
LACHNRPVHEVLFPIVRDVSQEYERTFKGMTAEPVELSELIATRERLIHELQHGLDADERKFLICFVRNQPEWELLGTTHFRNLPGIRWKLSNLEKLAKRSPQKFLAQANALEKLLDRE